jgi:Rrf2 family cysteine metabolism transcriptional repressor
MKLSRKGEYALRAMIVLAMSHGEAPVQTQEIADRERIPKKFLEQILLELKKAGLLESKRGAGGGYRLIKPPNEITLARVVRIIDGPLAPLSCVSTMAHVKCPEQEGCGLYRVMRDVRNAIADVLEGVTFADVCSRNRSAGGKRPKASSTAGKSKGTSQARRKQSGSRVAATSRKS